MLQGSVGKVLDKTFVIRKIFGETRTLCTLLGTYFFAFKLLGSVRVPMFFLESWRLAMFFPTFFSGWVPRGIFVTCFTMVVPNWDDGFSCQKIGFRDVCWAPHHKGWDILFL